MVKVVLHSYFLVIPNKEKKVFITIMQYQNQKNTNKKYWHPAYSLKYNN